MNINRLVYSIFILLLVCAFSIFGQTQPVEPTSSQKNRTTADENFQLSITSDRIIETNFARSTDVKLNTDARGGLQVEVGVGVRAEQINVLLRGIFGSVRFRASLEPLKNRITPQNSITPPR